MERLRRLKARIAMAAVVGFGIFSGLAMGHRAAAVSPAVTPPSSATQPAAGSQQPQQPQQPSDNGGFFGQSGAGDQGGYGFGNGNSGSGNSGPVAGTGLS